MKKDYLIQPLDFAINAVARGLCEYNKERAVNLFRMEGEIDETILHLGKPFTSEFWNVCYDLYTKELISKVEKNLLGIREPRKRKSCIAVEGVDCCGKTTFIENLVRAMKEFNLLSASEKRNPVFVPAETCLPVMAWYYAVDNGIGNIENWKFFVPYLMEMAEQEYAGNVKPSEYIALTGESSEPVAEDITTKFASSIFFVANLIALRKFWDSDWGNGIFDRSLLSTFVYNGAPQIFHRDSWLNLYDKIVLIIPDRKAGLSRLEKKFGKDDFDKFALEEYDRITDYYLRYAANNPKRFIVLEDDEHFDWGLDEYRKFLIDIDWLPQNEQAQCKGI